jgi:hypothetical protein
MVNFLETERVEGQRNYQTADRKAGTSVIDVDFALATGEPSLVELFQSQLGEVASLSAITSWGFTGSDLAVEPNIHPFDLSVMNTSGVVSAWGWSGPGVDGLSSDLNAHRVAGLDGLYSMPANGNLLQGIGDADSLIEDLNLWAYEEQVRAAQDKASPSDRNEISLDATSGDRFNHKGQNNEDRDADGEPDRARAKEKNIIHSAIFSQQPGLEGSQA